MSDANQVRLHAIDATMPANENQCTKAQAEEQVVRVFPGGTGSEFAGKGSDEI